MEKKIHLTMSIRSFFLNNSTKKEAGVCDFISHFSFKMKFPSAQLIECVICYYAETEDHVIVHLRFGLVF